MLFENKWGIPLLLLAILLAAAALLLLVSPDEATLGAGIKLVYVHVGLIRVGTLGLLLSGLLGLLGVFWANGRLLSWLRTVYIASFVSYLAGFMMAVWASSVNWGGIPLREPRFLSAIDILVVAAVCGLLLHWLPRPRLASLSAAVLLSLLSIGVQSGRITLHPVDPLSEAPVSIQNAFMGMFVLALLLWCWLVWVLRLKLRDAVEE